MYIYVPYIARIYIYVNNTMCMINAKRRRFFYFKIWVNVNASLFAVVFVNELKASVKLTTSCCSFSTNFLPSEFSLLTLSVLFAMEREGY